MIYNESTKWQEAADAWAKGETVWSAELGGLGPGYEQAIQILLFEILVRWPRETSVPEPEGDSYPRDYTKHVDTVAKALDETCGGFSGAQVGAAKATAYQFMRFGYGHMLTKLKSEDPERLIQVDKTFPHLPAETT